MKKAYERGPEFSRYYANESIRRAIDIETVNDAHDKSIWHARNIRVVNSSHDESLEGLLNLGRYFLTNQ